MANKFEEKLIKLEKELRELRHEIDMQTEKTIDEFWDSLADKAVDDLQKWR